MTWSEEDWTAYRVWLANWLAEHEHELPSQAHARSKSGRLTPLSKKHRWKFASEAWHEMRRTAARAVKGQ
jgi:hypothetical protein